jgi:hypothetical protein
MPTLRWLTQRRGEYRSLAKYRDGISTLRSADSVEISVRTDYPADTV